MELDGYNREHSTAFEYQGEQHYRPIYGRRALQQTQRNDECKRQLCRYHGVWLIRVPFWKKDVRGFLENKLKKRGSLPWSSVH